MTAAPHSSAGWVAIAYGALDVSASDMFADGAELLVLPADPAEPFCLTGEGARMWRRIVAGPVTPTKDAEREMLEAMTALGIASTDSAHPARIARLDPPRLSSPFHELAYALTAHVAAEHGIPCVFIKGPALHHQGLRAREHSGDVDVWCPPARWNELADALVPWGWRRSPDPWHDTPVPHSITMTPGAWGCEIDVHRRVPGLILDDASAFDIVSAACLPVHYAGTTVPVPAPDVHAVLAAVNEVRPVIGARRRSRATASAAVGVLLATEGTRDRARELGAVPALRDEMVAAFGADAVDDTAILPRDWLWRARPDTARAYLAALRTVPLPERLRIFVRVLWPDDEVALASARHAGAPTDDPARARRQRLARAVRGWAFRRRPGTPRASDGAASRPQRNEGMPT
ncbi:hypothetical protein [Microbacterium sp. SLBN-111]|uniref:hypothetical protein n=1 Tax=Microbacterium sp. SLBN-111 TaxID=3377733 RepID=UPI003C745F8F